MNKKTGLKKVRGGNNTSQAKEKAESVSRKVERC